MKCPKCGSVFVHRSNVGHNWIMRRWEESWKCMTCRHIWTCVINLDQQGSWRRLGVMVNG